MMAKEQYAEQKNISKLTFFLQMDLTISELRTELEKKIDYLIKLTEAKNVV
jgi:hypothetical protein